MNYIKIKNDFLSAEINPIGAELTKVTGTNGDEFLWCGDEKIWGGHAPIVFPICGALKGGKYTVDGREYALEKHGFIRHTMFECTECGTDYAKLRAQSSDETLKCYPFEFDFTVEFKLTSNSLSVTYTTLNRSDSPMYYSCGAHEAYACPEGIEEYGLVFDNDTVLNSYRTENASLILPGFGKLPLENSTLWLKKEMFVDDSLIFKNHKSRKISLKKRGGEKRIEVDFKGFDYLIIWTKPEGDYICIEPWAGIPDNVDASGKIEEKEGITKLQPHCEKSVTHIITFD